MVVAITPVQRPVADRRPERESDMDKIHRALQIANAGLGIAVNWDNWRNADKLRTAKAQTEMAKQEKLAAETGLAQARTAGQEATTAAAPSPEEAQETRRLQGEELKARIADLKSKAKKAQQDQAVISGATEATADLFKRVPKEFRKDAIKEQGIVQELARSTEVIGGAYDTFAETGFIEGRVPFTEAKARIDAAESQIMASLQANWKGPMSDSDLERIGGIMPDLDDTPAQTAAKKQKMLDLLRANSKPTPTLDAFKIQKETGQPAGENKQMMDAIKKANPDKTASQHLRLKKIIMDNRKREAEQGGQ